MNFETPFDQTWEFYKVMRDCIKIAQRSMLEKNSSLLQKTTFLTKSESAVAIQIKKGKNGVDDYVILSLWATFERFIINYIETQVSTPSSAFGRQLHGIILKNIEYWKIDDTLDALKVIIDSDLIGQAKQIKRYRDWVAHRNVKKKLPATVTPQRAYSVLAEIYGQLSSETGIEPHVMGKGGVCPKCAHDELKFLYYGRGPLGSANSWYGCKNCGYKFQNFESANDD